MGGDEIGEYISYLRFEKKYSPHTLSSYERDLNQFVTYLSHTYPGTDLVSGTHFHIRSWLVSLKEQDNNARTINRKLSALSSMFTYLQKNGICASNPVRKLHAMKLPERLPSALKETETSELISETVYREGFTGKTEQLICELLYATGMRRAELVALRETDVHWGRSVIAVTGKGNKTRSIFISDTLLDSIRDYLAEKHRLYGRETAQLLVLNSGLPLYPEYVNRVVKKYLSGITSNNKKTPHVLRHSFATHLLNNGANIQAIKELLGHSSLAATQVYTHNDISRLKEIHRINHPRG